MYELQLLLIGGLKGKQVRRNRAEQMYPPQIIHGDLGFMVRIDVAHMVIAQSKR
jgi:hypothetical protein